MKSPKSVDFGDSIFCKYVVVILLTSTADFVDCGIKTSDIIGKF
ncbi:hypothetical protein [Chryseobacterium elymi]|nr:hypothetical protein [Chryseobacterium elymi]